MFVLLDYSGWLRCRLRRACTKAKVERGQGYLPVLGGNLGKLFQDAPTRCGLRQLPALLSGEAIDPILGQESLDATIDAMDRGREIQRPLQLAPCCSDLPLSAPPEPGGQAGVHEEECSGKLQDNHRNSSDGRTLRPPNEPRFSCGHQPALTQFNGSTAATGKPRLHRRPSLPQARQLQAGVRRHRVPTGRGAPRVAPAGSPAGPRPEARIRRG